MLEHHIQRKIIKRLSSSEGLSFSELQPEELDNKLFDYHLKSLIRDDLVIKSGSGQYQLTEKGRLLSVGAGRPETPWQEKAYSIIFTIIKDQSSGKFLLAERLSHPLLGGLGLMHHHPRAGESVIELAESSTLEKTCLNVSLSFVGGGYLAMYEADELESYVHYTLLYGECTGELQQNYERSRFYWADEMSSELSHTKGLASARRMVKQWQDKEPFVDEIIRVTGQ